MYLLLAVLLVPPVQDPVEAVETPPAWKSVPVQAEPQDKLIRIRTPEGQVTDTLNTLFVAHAVDTVRIMASASMVGGGTALLLDLHGWSRGSGGEMGQCGAGEERALLWVRVAEGRVTTTQVAPYASCLLSSEGEVSQGADSLWADWDDYATRRHIRALFRLDDAAKGLQFTTSALPAQ